MRRFFAIVARAWPSMTKQPNGRRLFSKRRAEFAELAEAESMSAPQVAGGGQPSRSHLSALAAFYVVVFVQGNTAAENNR